MSEYTSIEEHFLPQEMRIDLCMTLLENAGADKINLREERGEIIHCCVMPWHSETRPSASLNFERLTYRCLGCNARGGLWWLIATVLDLEFDQAKEWLEGTTGLGGHEFQLGPLLEFLDAVDAAGKRKGSPSLPRYSEKVLEPWNYIYPGLTTGVPELGIEGRGIPEENLAQGRVGWDMEANRIIIPLFLDDHGLVGWQSRRILDDGTPKYKSTPDFPRDSTILGASKDRRQIIVVESPMSYYRHLHHAPVAATWGSVVTPQQVQILKWYDEVVFFTDNDLAGWRTVEGYVDEKGRHHRGAAEQVMDYTSVTVVEYDWHADPAQLDDEEFDRLVAARIPLAVWERPTGTLRCIRCREKHTGYCADLALAG